MSTRSFGYYLKLISVLALDVVSALTARQAYNTDSLFFTILAMASLALAGYFFIKLLDEHVTVIINSIWIALGSINVTLAGFLVFGEKVTKIQIFGMVITIAGLIFLDLFAPNEPKGTDDKTHLAT